VRLVATTRRLTLAEVSVDEWPIVAKLAREPGFDDFMGSRDAPPTDAEVQRWVEFWIGLYPRGLGMWCVRRRDEHVPIGVVGVKPREGHDILELKYNIAREHWGQGFGTEAAEAALVEAPLP
jgi:RimJ/RimL family protein N-acetyltransferase